MKSYFVNTTVNFEKSKFYVRPGDLLSYDAQHGNSLAVYRNGQLLKVLKQDPLAVEAFVKSGFIVEVRAPQPEKAKDVPERTLHLPSYVGVVPQPPVAARDEKPPADLPAKEPPKEGKKRKKEEEPRQARIDDPVRSPKGPPSQSSGRADEPEQSHLADS